MTALLGSDTTPIASTADLVAYFAAGAKSPAAWRIGIEQEKVGVTPDGGPVPFSGPAGIEALLTQLEAEGYPGVREDGHLLGVRGPGETVTVEPGGQLEFSGPALPTAAACADSLVRHVRAVSQ